MVVGIVSLTLLTACEGGVNASVRNLLVPDGPQGMTQTINAAQPLNIAKAATPADPGRTANQLQGDAYLGGYARTWTRGPEAVEVLEFAFGDEFHSRDFVHFELLELSKGLGVFAAPHPTVPDSTIFTFNGKTRARSRQVFCQGSWFVVAQYAFEVTDCSDTLRYPNLMVDLTQRQYLATVAALGVPAELVSPSPGG